MTRSHEEAQERLLLLWDKLDLVDKNYFLDSVEDTSGYEGDFFWLILLFLILLNGYRKKNAEESEKLSNGLRPSPIPAYPSVDQYNYNTEWREAEELIKRMGGRIDYPWT